MTKRLIILSTPFVVTNDYPALPAGTKIQKPVDSPLPEMPLANDFTDEQLRAIIKEQSPELLGGVKLYPNAIESLPAGYLHEAYMSVIYGLPTSPMVFPVRAGATYSTSWLAMCAYPIVSCLLSSLYKYASVTIDPVMKYRAENILRLLRFVNYTWLQAAQLHTTNPTERNKVVCSRSKEITSLNGQVEETEIFYLNSLLAQPLIDAGTSAEDLVEFYVTTGTQPS